MAARGEPARPKTAADLTRWLEREVGPRLQDSTEAIAHGGTALTLLGIRDSTKDVDFAFRTRESFDRFVGTLKSLGFRMTADFRPVPSEVFHRFENPSSVVDVVDVRFPTWNNWRLTKAVLRNALVMPFGNVRLVRPDRDAVFLFKTYPLRETDLDDLRTILKASSPDEPRVIALFEEQDALHRSELLVETTHEPLLNIIELRTRFAASMRLLGPSHRRRVPRIARRAQTRFEELRLRPSLTDLIRRIRAKEGVMTWEDVLDESGNRLRKRLTKAAIRKRAGSPRASTGSKRRPRHPR